MEFALKNPLEDNVSPGKTALFQSIQHFNLMTHGIIKKKKMQEVKQPTRCEAQKVKGHTQGHRSLREGTELVPMWPSPVRSQLHSGNTE